MRLLLLLLLFVLPLSAAGETERVVITYAEPFGTSLRLEADVAAGWYADYLFAPEIGEEDRAVCMAQTERLMSMAHMSVKPEICVLPAKSFGGTCIDGTRLYISPMDWESIEYAALVLQTCGGRYAHYGLSYGYACLLTGKTAELRFPEEQTVCDLNLLCFDDSFVSPQDAAAARSMACAFAEEYVQEYGLTVCAALLCRSGTEAGAAEVQQELKLFCQRHGVAAQPASLRVGHGGRTYQYCVQLGHGEFFVHPSWKDANWQANPLLTENFLHEDYAQTRDFFLTNDEQMQRYRRLFDADATGDGLQVILPGRIPGIDTSCYQAVEHRILLLNVDSLSHEYIHALAQPRPEQPLWETEGFARYFSYYYDAYGVALLNEDYNHPADTAQAQYVREYLAEIGRAIDMAQDYGDIESIIAYTRDYASPNLSYASGSAYVHYLTVHYGEAAVIRHVVRGEALPDSEAERICAWRQWLGERYGDYTKYVTAPTVTLPPWKKKPGGQ